MKPGCVLQHTARCGRCWPGNLCSLLSSSNGWLIAHPAVVSPSTTLSCTSCLVLCRLEEWVSIPLSCSQQIFQNISGIVAASAGLCLIVLSWERPSLTTQVKVPFLPPVQALCWGVNLCPVTHLLSLVAVTKLITLFLSLTHLCIVLSDLGEFFGQQSDLKLISKVPLVFVLREAVHDWFRMPGAVSSPKSLCFCSE